MTSLMNAPRSIIETDNRMVNEPEAIVKYYDTENTWFKSDWDVVQQRLRCCGFDTYRDHLNYPKPNNSYTCVPESCCIDYADGKCAKKSDISGDCNKLLMKIDPWISIYVHGCLQTLRTLYQRELKTQLLIFGLFDVLIVMFEIVSCALAAAYVAQVKLSTAFLQAAL